MKIAFWGTSEFVGSIQKARFLRGLIAAGIRPQVVITAPDTPGGRGRKFISPALKSAALEFGLPVVQPSKLVGFAQELAKLEIELSLVVAYGKILPPEALAVPKFGSLNVHPSLLSRWRGPTPIQAAISAGDPVTGVTIIQMDEQMDHGPIIAKREFPLGERAWSAPELSDALTDLGVELFLEIFEHWVRGEMTPRPQNHEAATYCRILKREDGHIDWAKPAEIIERMTRAFQPWPGAYAFWQDGGKNIRLVIEKAEVKSKPRRPNGSGLRPLASEKEEGSWEAGTVAAAEGGFSVQTGEGILEIVRLKPEGKSAMSGEAFLRGHHDILGSRLE